MENNSGLPPRSNNTRGDERQKLTPVIKKKVIVRKASPFKTFLSKFFAEDSVDMKDFLIWELIVPEVKSVVQNFIDALFWGDGKRPNSSSRRSTGNVPYSSISTQRARGEGKRMRTDYGDAAARFGLEEIITDTKQEAEDVLRTMDELIDMYGKVSVADLFELINESCEYNATYYGWTDLRGAYVSRTRGGWLINLPRCIYLR